MKSDKQEIHPSWNQAGAASGTLLRKPFLIEPQPSDTTCGPTCLHSVYRHLGDDIGLSSLIKEVRALKEGGTLGVLLGIHALKRGYNALLYSYNLRVFDPSWFDFNHKKLMKKLKKSLDEKTNPKTKLAIRSYYEFLELGGEIRFAELTGELIESHLNEGSPILTGLSSTYLYREVREIAATGEASDTAGDPAGHFVVLYGLDKASHEVELADPWQKNPLGRRSFWRSKKEAHYYRVNMQRLINAILLGVLSYDGNLLILTNGNPDKKP